MSFIGKLHEISLYGFISAIVCVIKKKITFVQLWNARFHFSSFLGFFRSYLFWASVLFIPISIIGAIATRFCDDGEGLTFDSKNIVVIMFAHIAEDILGLVLTPIWFIRDLVKGDLEDTKAVDYFLWLIEIIYIGINLFLMFK
ncbi:MAG: hypothetical protein J6M17_03555 [Ruminococcus sp.]|nr:hypothetical protein [Ruminococcus sp.]